MKRVAVVLVFAFVVSVAAQSAPAAQADRQPVAVFMSGEEPAGAKGSYKILGAELAKAITGSGKYTAVDRTEAIQKQIGREHEFQRSGAVSDDQIRKLGAQLGVQFLCVAEVNQVEDSSFFLEARLVDIVTAEVVEIATVNNTLKTAKEMIRAAQRIARVLVTGKSGDESAEELNSRGRALLNVDIDKAIAAFTDAIAQEPNEADYRNNRGNAYVRKKDADKAIIDYTEAIRLKPGEAEYHYSRGYVYFRKGDYDNAIADLTEALGIKPGSVRCLIGRGAAYHRKGELERAAADIEAALRIEPDNVDAKDILKNIREEQARAKVHEDNISAAAHYSRGQAFFLNGDYESAAAEYSNAIGLVSDNAIYFNARGIAYSSSENYDSAIVDFTSAIRLKGDDAMYYYNRGAAYYNSRGYERAIGDFQTVLRFEPDNADVKALIEAALKEIEKRDAPPPPEVDVNVNRTRQAHLHTHAGYHGVSYDDIGSGGGAHWGLGVAGFLRTERTNKFGLALGISQTGNSVEDEDGYEFSLSSSSLYLQPIYRVGSRRRYFDAAFTIDIPLSQTLRVRRGGHTISDESYGADVVYALDLSGRFQYVGLGFGRSLSGDGVTSLNASLFWSMGSYLELVPTFAYYWGNGWGMYSVSVGVGVSFW